MRSGWFLSMTMFVLREVLRRLEKRAQAQLTAKPLVWPEDDDPFSLLEDWQDGDLITAEGEDDADGSLPGID